MMEIAIYLIIGCALVGYMLRSAIKRDFFGDTWRDRVVVSTFAIAAVVFWPIVLIMEILRTIPRKRDIVLKIEITNGKFAMVMGRKK